MRRMRVKFHGKPILVLDCVLWREGFMFDNYHEKCRPLRHDAHSGNQNAAHTLVSSF